MHLGRYEVIRKIGAGGFGEVLLARSLGAEGFERIVAVKRLRGELTRKEGGLQGIINEARIGGLLNHPNVVQVLEFIQVGSDYLLVMEYVDGLGLQDLLDLDRTQPNLLEPAHAFDIIIQACEGLHYAHSARSSTGQPLKLIHRDIKPSNLMVTRTGTVKVMDFGVARAVTNSGQSSTGSIKGTLRYLSPEQAEGSKEIGHSSDLFSLGLVLCEMINKQPVYEAEQEHLVLLKALQGKNTAAIELAETRVPGLGSFLKKCLAYHQEERYRSAEEMSLALRQLRVRYPYQGEGLAGLVEKALTFRGPHPYEDDISTDATFSLQLKRKPLKLRRGAAPDPELPTEQVPRATFLAALKPTAALETPKTSPEPRDLEELMDDGAWEWEWRMEERSDAAAWAGEEFDRVAPPSQPIVQLTPPSKNTPPPRATPAAPMLSRASLELNPTGGSKNGAAARPSTTPRKPDAEPLAAISLWGSEPRYLDPPAARGTSPAPAPTQAYEGSTDRILAPPPASVRMQEGSTDRIVPARLKPPSPPMPETSEDDGEVFESGIFDMEDILDDPASIRLAQAGAQAARLSLNAAGAVAIPSAAARLDADALTEQKTQRVDPEVARKVREQAAALLKAQAEARKAAENAIRAEAARKAAEEAESAETARKAAAAAAEKAAAEKAAAEKAAAEKAAAERAAAERAAAERAAAERAAAEKAAAERAAAEKAAAAAERAAEEAARAEAARQAIETAAEEATPLEGAEEAANADTEEGATPEPSADLTAHDELDEEDTDELNPLVPDTEELSVAEEAAVKAREQRQAELDGPTVERMLPSGPSRKVRVDETVARGTPFALGMTDPRGIPVYMARELAEKAAPSAETTAPLPARRREQPPVPATPPAASLNVGAETSATESAEERSRTVVQSLHETGSTRVLTPQRMVRSSPAPLITVLEPPAPAVQGTTSPRQFVLGFVLGIGLLGAGFMLGVAWERSQSTPPISTSIPVEPEQKPTSTVPGH